MWPFNRRKTDTKAVPPEVKQYYASEHRERVGLAWLVAFLSLIVTVAVIAGLFFGGRWAYRKLAHKNTTPTVGVSTPEVSPAPATNPTTPSKPSNLQPTAPPPTNDSKVTVNPKPEPKASTPSPSPSPQPTTKAITNTGPGSTLAIFLAVTILASAAHSLVTSRKLTSH